jgi:hypothetical protein
MNCLRDIEATSTELASNNVLIQRLLGVAVGLYSCRTGHAPVEVNWVKITSKPRK